MKRHKWDEYNSDTCLKCGVTREKKTFKLLMAISNQPPYNHYKYEQKYVYTIGNGDKRKKTTQRPECKNK